MLWQIQLWQHVLDDEVTAVLDLIRFCELYVELVAGLRHQGNRDQLCILVNLSELAI